MNIYEILLIGFVLSLVLAGLKLERIVNWPWVLILAPLLLAVGASVVYAIFVIELLKSLF